MLRKRKIKNGKNNKQSHKNYESRLNGSFNNNLFQKIQLPRPQNYGGQIEYFRYFSIIQ
jgi:hypothetical protein